MPRLLLLGGLFTPLGANPSAQEEDPFFEDELAELLGETDEAAGGLLQDWKGFVELKPRAFFGDRDGENENQELVLESEFELDLRFSERLSGYLRPRLFVDAFDDRSLRLEPFEAYVTLEEEGWDLRLGQFVENWGIADTFNPIDVLNRRDLGIDALDPPRLGEFGLRYRRQFAGSERFGEPTLSLYALPFFRPTRFGSRERRLGPDSSASPFDEDPGFEPDGSDEVFLASRLQSTWSTGFANSDLQLVLARGPARTPSFGLAANGDLTPAYYGATTLGAGIRSVPNAELAGDFLASLTLKAELVFTDTYSLPDSPAGAPGDYLAYVLGLDRSWYGAFGEAGDITMTLEHAGESGQSGGAGLLRPFRDDLIGRVLFEGNDFARQSLELRALVDLENHERIYEALYERQLRALHEDLKLTVQLQLFHPAGAQESFFGSLDDLSSLAVGLRWDF